MRASLSFPSLQGTVTTLSSAVAEWDYPTPAMVVTAGPREAAVPHHRKGPKLQAGTLEGASDATDKKFRLLFYFLFFFGTGD